MMSTPAPPSIPSVPQRRCQVSPTPFLPGQIATIQVLGSLDDVDDVMAQEDIASAGLEVQRYHRLAMAIAQNGSYTIEGTPLNQRLCLLQWLRRGPWICPAFITQQFTPASKVELKQWGTAYTLYDDTSLHTLVNLYPWRLQKPFECRGIRFPRLYLRYCLPQYHAGIIPKFNPLQ